MLYDEIIHAVEAETVIEQKAFENEKISGMNAEKVMFEHVQLIKCQMPGNDLNGGEFIDVVFDGCDLSNCHLKNAYFKDCKFLNCKLDGCSFCSASFKSTKMENCSSLYCNYVSTLWENTLASDTL